MTRTRKFTVRGHKMQTASQRRFVVVHVRAEDITVTADSEAHRIFQRPVGTFVAFADIVKRTDSIATARTFAQRQRQRHVGVGVKTVIVDTVTGQEV